MRRWIMESWQRARKVRARAAGLTVSASFLAASGMLAGGCAGGESARTGEPVTDLGDPRFRPTSAELAAFARTSGVELARQVMAQPAIARSSGPIWIALLPVENATERPLAHARTLTGQMWSSLAGSEALPSRVAVFVPAGSGERGGTWRPGSLSDAPVAPPEGTPPERVFELSSLLGELDRPGVTDSIVYFDVTLTNAATRVAIMNVQLDSRQFGGGR